MKTWDGVYIPNFPDTVNPARLMRAITWMESSGGYNNWPRIEPAFLPEGRRYTVQGRLIVGTGKYYNAIVERRFKMHGMVSAASWGVFQILAHTAWDSGAYPENFSPVHLWKTWVSIIPVKKHLKRIAADGARTVAQFADAWNSGNHRDTIIPTDYIKGLENAYNRDADINLFDDNW